MRWFLRLLGKVLICTGLLMFGFVAYQLWGTGIEYARAQDRAEDQFNETLERVSTSTTTPTSTSTSTSTTTPTTIAPGVTTVSGSIVPITLATTSTTTATTTVPGSEIVDYADVIEAMDITEGEPIGFINLVPLDQGMYIFPGVSREDLKNGPGHFPETPMPGQVGNAAIAGHRTTYGQPFFHLDELKVGDEIIVTMPYGEFTYVVTSTEVVDPGDREVIATTQPDLATLTLATCHPIGTARQRLIIHAELDREKSSTPGLPVINYGRDTLIPTSDGLADENGAEPTAAAAATTLAPITTRAPTATAAQTATTVEPTGPSTSAATTLAPTVPSTTFIAAPTTVDPIHSVSPGDATTGGPGDLFASDDEAFSNRWFSDEEAFPQVTLWAGSCVAMTVAAYQLAKRFRNLAVGLAVGGVPFVIGLYFFYQNLNRLLPSAI